MSDNLARRQQVEKVARLQRRLEEAAGEERKDIEAQLTVAQARVKQG